MAEPFLIEHVNVTSVKYGRIKLYDNLIVRYVHIFESYIQINNNMSTNQHVSKLAFKRWQTYLKEENENNRRFVDKSKYFVILILSIIKFVLWIRGNIRSKRRHIVEKICVE